MGTGKEFELDARLLKTFLHQEDATHATLATESEVDTSEKEVYPDEKTDFKPLLTTNKEDVMYGRFKGYLLFDSKLSDLTDIVDGIENLWGDELEQRSIRKKKVKAIINGQSISLKVIKAPKKWLKKAIQQEDITGTLASFVDLVKVEVEPLSDWNYDESGEMVYDEEALYWCYDVYAKIVLASLAIPGGIGLATVVGKKELATFTKEEALSYGLWDLAGAYRPGYDAFSLATKVEMVAYEGVVAGSLRGLESWFGQVPIECVEDVYTEEEVYNGLALVPSFLDLEDVWSGVDYHMYEGSNDKGIYDVYLRYYEQGQLFDGPVFRVEFEAL